MATKEDQDSAIALAEKMAKVAGTVQPSVMTMACIMLLECSWLSTDIESYWQFKELRSKGKAQCTAIQ